MGETRTSNPARHLLARTRTLFSGRLLERLRHATWAGLISLVMYAVLLLEPVDQFWWLHSLVGHWDHSVPYAYPTR